MNCLNPARDSPMREKGSYNWPTKGGLQGIERRKIEYFPRNIIVITLSSSLHLEMVLQALTTKAAAKEGEARKEVDDAAVNASASLTSTFFFSYRQFIYAYLPNTTVKTLPQICITTTTIHLLPSFMSIISKHSCCNHKL